MHPAVTFGQTTRIAYVLLMNNINFRPIPLNGMDLVIIKSIYKNVFQEFVSCNIICRKIRFKSIAIWYTTIIHSNYSKIRKIKYQLWGKQLSYVNPRYCHKWTKNHFQVDKHFINDPSAWIESIYRKECWLNILLFNSGRENCGKKSFQKIVSWNVAHSIVFKIYIICPFRNLLKGNIRDLNFEMKLRDIL